MKQRLAYRGGNQRERMRADKLHSLKKSLDYSYQAETLEFDDGRQFKCLINPNKLVEKYDQKVLSIPFEDVAINSATKEIEKIELMSGDVFKWVENNTYWMIYLHHLEEEAYFRADIRKCEWQIKLDNGKNYWVYWESPEEEEIAWATKNGVSYNQLDNSAVFYIKKTEDTLRCLKRFTVLRVDNQNWEIQVVSSFQGLLKVSMKETFSNRFEEEKKTAKDYLVAESIKEENGAFVAYQDSKYKTLEDNVGYLILQKVTTKDKEQIEGSKSAIKGDRQVKPYTTHTYSIVGAQGGDWKVSNKKATISRQDNNQVTLTVMTGRSGEFDLIYTRENEADISLNIKIISL